MIMTLSLLYFFLDIASLPANLYYLWSVTAPLEDTEAILGDMNVLIISFSLAIVQIVQVVAF